MEIESQFKTLHFSPKWVKPINLIKIVLPSLYEKTIPINKEKYKDMLGLPMPNTFIMNTIQICTI